MKNIFLLILGVIYIALVIYYQSIQALPLWGVYLLVASNILSFLFYGMDKLAAIKHWQRTPEKHFYCLALLSGWPASILAQIVFSHKTSKVSFRRWFYMMSLINIGLVVAYLFYFPK